MNGDPRQPPPREIGHLRAPIVLAHEPPFRIGDAEFGPATREVRFSGQTSIVEPRVMQFLIALHRAAGAVVNKDDLLQSCWDGRIVGDDAINRVVSRLRGVADKEAGRQFRIETITRVGYRLLPAGGEAPDADGDPPSPAGPVSIRRTTLIHRYWVGLVAAAVLVAAAITGVWWFLKPAPAATHGMLVGLSGFRALTKDLPATVPETISAEIVAAFNVDGLVAVSIVPSSANRDSPPYSLDGTIYRVGDSIRVISRLSNSRTGVVLWSDSVDYAPAQVAVLPRKVAADVGTVVRCGLSGAATYPKALPDAVLSNYLHYCQEYWSYGGSKTLRYAKLVVASAPDFSWGWSAVGNGYMQSANMEPDRRRAAALRAAGRQAEDKAVALDLNNSEALGHKAQMIGRFDWLGREALFKRAIAAKPLDCGCEHYGYGWNLQNVGRLNAAIDQFRAATDMLALWPDSQLAMAEVLVATGRGRQAQPYVAAAIDLSKDPELEKSVAVSEGVETGDYEAAIAALRSPQFRIVDQDRAALLSGYEALQSGDRQAGAKAIRKLLALPTGQHSDTVATLLASLGANRDALRIAGQKPWLFWRRSMRGVLHEPGFPAVADRLGLTSYWRTSQTKPDICLSRDEPPFCRMI